MNRLRLRNMNEENVIPASDLELLERTLEEVHNGSINNTKYFSRELMYSLI